MSGSNSAPSIIEYSSDLASQEAPSPLPVGEYPGEVVKAENKVSTTSGNTYCQVTFRIDADAYPIDFTEGDPDGTLLTYNRVLVLPDTGVVRWRLKKFLTALGAKLGRSFDPADLMGLTATVVIEHRDFEGEQQAQIARVIAA